MKSSVPPGFNTRATSKARSLDVVVPAVTPPENPNTDTTQSMDAVVQLTRPASCFRTRAVGIFAWIAAPFTTSFEDKDLIFFKMKIVMRKREGAR